MKYPLEKYDYYTHTLPDGTIEVIAKSTYAGKTVKGKAKCHPEDTFDVETGKKLAALRCARKVAEKRMCRSVDCVNEAKEMLAIAEQYLNDMRDYYTDSAIAWSRADDELKFFVKEIKGE